jgi:hypothetical protein
MHAEDLIPYLKATNYLISIIIKKPDKYIHADDLCPILLCL